MRIFYSTRMKKVWKLMEERFTTLASYQYNSQRRIIEFDSEMVLWG